MTPRTTGLLIIRAWVEQGSVQPLRAHIRLTTNVADGFAGEMTLTDVTAVCTVMEAWVRDVLLNGQIRPSSVLPGPDV